MCKVLALTSGEGLLLYCYRLDAITGLEREIVGKERKNGGERKQESWKLCNNCSWGSFCKTLLRPQDLLHSSSQC